MTITVQPIASTFYEPPITLHEFCSLWACTIMKARFHSFPCRLPRLSKRYAHEQPRGRRNILSVLNPMTSARDGNVMAERSSLPL